MPIRKVVVIGFEQAVIDTIRPRVRRVVCAKQDPIGVSQKESTRGVRLSSEFRGSRSDVDVIVRQTVEHTAYVSQILRVAAHVGANESRARMAGNDVFESLEQGFQPWKLRTVEAPFGRASQLVPALVRLFQRLKESDRVANMNEHRKTQFTGPGPNRIEARAIHPDELPLAIPHPQ